MSNGSRTCGLLPFNPDAIDYTKCLANGSPQIHEYGSNTQLKTMEYDMFCKIVGTDILHKFQTFKEVIGSENKTEEIYMLFKMWFFFQKGYSWNWYGKLK